MNFRTFQHLSRPLYSLVLLAVLGLATVLMVSACGGSDRTARRGTPTPTLTFTPTFPPTPTSTPIPLGSPDNPFVIGLVSESENPQMNAAGEALAQKIAAISKVSVAGKVYPSYNQLLESMGEGNVHVSWMPPLTYLYASQHGLAEVILLTNHFGVYQYGTQYMANVSSGFTPYFDPISGLNSTDAATALEQFKGLRPCWVDPQSASGYILPAGLLLENDIPSLPGVMAQSHTAVVRALYIKGICDFGASFSISGDPRTAAAVQQDLPDAMNRILIIWRSDANIPNVNLSLLAGLSEANRQTLTNAFLELGKTPDGRALLALSAGNYQIDEIKVVSDSIYDPLRESVTALNLDLKEMVGK